MVIRDKSYRSCYEETLKMAEEVRNNIDVGVFVTVGPYPVDYIKLREKFGRDNALSIMKEGMDFAAELCQEGKCIAIGEIGRPHFPVDAETIEDSNEILLYGMQKARDVDFPVVLSFINT